MKLPSSLLQYNSQLQLVQSNGYNLLLSHALKAGSQRFWQLFAPKLADCVVVQLA
jgi:hypothetical protein